MSDQQLPLTGIVDHIDGGTADLISRLATTASQGTKIAPGEHRTFMVPDGYHLEDTRPELEPLKPLSPRRVIGTTGPKPTPGLPGEERRQEEPQPDRAGICRAPLTKALCSIGCADVELHDLLTHALDIGVHASARVISSQPNSQ